MINLMYDPRYGILKESDNPAIFMANILYENGLPVDWDRVKEVADWCEEKTLTTEES